MSHTEGAGVIWRDKLRELLFPAMVLAIIGTLWVVGYAEDRQDIADQPLPPLAIPSAHSGPGLSSIVPSLPADARSRHRG